MKFETVTVTQRRNIGNYEHIEITTTARIEEGEDFVSAAMTARTYVEAVLHMPLEAVKAHQEPVKTEPVTYDEETKQNLPVSEVKGKKERKARTTKPKVEEVKEEDAFNGQDIPPVIEEKKEIPVVKYDRGMDAHKSMLSSYLTKNFPEWKSFKVKTKQQVIDFNSSLHGKDFLDGKGMMLDSFKDILSGFYA